MMDSKQYGWKWLGMMHKDVAKVYTKTLISSNECSDTGDNFISNVMSGSREKSTFINCVPFINTGQRQFFFALRDIYDISQPPNERWR